MANPRQYEFLADAGIDLLESWRRTGMSSAEVMAEKTFLVD